VLVFEERGKLEYPEKNLSEQSREPTNSVHRDIGGRRALSPLRQPCSPKTTLPCSERTGGNVAGLAKALFSKQKLHHISHLSIPSTAVGEHTIVIPSSYLKRLHKSPKEMLELGMNVRAIRSLTNFRNEIDRLLSFS